VIKETSEQGDEQARRRWVSGVKTEKRGGERK
jgi:hypothetical protein